MNIKYNSQSSKNSKCTITISSKESNNKYDFLNDNQNTYLNSQINNDVKVININNYDKYYIFIIADLTKKDYWVREIDDLRDEKKALRSKEEALRDEKKALRSKEKDLRDREEKVLLAFGFEPPGCQHFHFNLQFLTFYCRFNPLSFTFIAIY